MCVSFLSTVFASQLGLMISKVGGRDCFLPFMPESNSFHVCVFVIMTEHAAKTCLHIRNAVFNVGVGLDKERKKAKRQNVFAKLTKNLLHLEKIR